MFDFFFCWFCQGNYFAYASYSHGNSRSSTVKATVPGMQFGYRLKYVKKTGFVFSFILFSSYMFFFVSSPVLVDATLGNKNVTINQKTAAQFTTGAIIVPNLAGETPVNVYFVPLGKYRFLAGNVPITISNANTPSSNIVYDAIYVTWVSECKFLDVSKR
jgi:hypothetical protein